MQLIRRIQFLCFFLKLDYIINVDAINGNTTHRKANKRGKYISLNLTYHKSKYLVMEKIGLRATKNESLFER